MKVFSFSGCSPDEIVKYSNEIKNAFPNEEFIFMPDWVTCMDMNQEQLKQVIDKLTEIYEGIKVVKGDNTHYSSNFV